MDSATGHISQMLFCEVHRLTDWAFPVSLQAYLSECAWVACFPKLLLLSTTEPPISSHLSREHILSLVPPRENTLDLRSLFWGLREQINEIVMRGRPRKGIITVLTVVTHVLETHLSGAEQHQTFMH